MDHQFTLKVKAWLEAESHTEPLDILEGATMLLQLNRNRALYNTISRQPLRYVEKIRYELQKFLPSRLAGMTMDDVVKLEEETLPAISEEIKVNSEESDSSESLPLRAGKRADHDQLPENIQAIWQQNAERWKKIKEEYNTCLSLSAPCDRYEHVTLLKELWYKYKAEFDRYDSFKLEPKDNEGENKEIDPVKLAADINSAQKYVSKYAKALIDAKAQAMADDATEKQITAYEEKRKTMQEKVVLLIENGKTLTDATMEKLAEGGIAIDAIINAKTTDDAKGEDSDTPAAETAQ